ncbi:MAG TPA: BamA/TamA family outer membrane protein [Candidatus Polarisedimenticolia bacterium]|nr:BamA/TamA family outer membrane protein [Candidatus Polarisedimenticolia bacterium]
MQRGPGAGTLCALVIPAVLIAPLRAAAVDPEIQVEIVAPPAPSDIRPVLTEGKIQDAIRPLLRSGCDEPTIARALEQRYRFLGYVPRIEVSCSERGARLRVRESSHTVDVITFDPAELETIGVHPSPDVEEQRRLYPVPADAPKGVLRGLLQTRTGDLYNFERYRADSDALQRMGYGVAFIPGGQKADSSYASGAYLIQSLTPRIAGPGPGRKTNYLGGTGSYGPRTKSALGLLYEKDELFGRLDQLSIAPSYNAAAGGTISYTAPLLSRREEPRTLFDLDLSLFSEYRHNRLLDGVLTDERQTGFAATIGVRPLGLRAPHGLRYYFGLRRARITLRDTAPGERDGNTDTIQIGASYEWRHTFRRPSLSARLDPSVDFAARAGGGERTFVRPGVDFTLHGRYATGIEAELHLKGGLIDRDVPSFELWSLGGASTVRGFREDSFLGRHLAALQAEVWLPFVPRQSDASPGPGGENPDTDFARIPVEPRAARLLKWALFVDGGTIARTTAGTKEAIAGAGVGIRFIVPRHPLVIRIDYGWGLGSLGGDAFPYVSLGYRY